MAVSGDAYGMIIKHIFQKIWEDPGLWEHPVHNEPPDPPASPNPPAKLAP